MTELFGDDQAGTSSHSDGNRLGLSYRTQGRRLLLRHRSTQSFQSPQPTGIKPLSPYTSTSSEFLLSCVLHSSDVNVNS